jgi:hypothetical protein
MRTVVTQVRAFVGVVVPVILVTIKVIGGGHGIALGSPVNHCRNWAASLSRPHHRVRLPLWPTPRPHPIERGKPHLKGPGRHIGIQSKAVIAATVSMKSHDVTAPRRQARGHLRLALAVLSRGIYTQGYRYP